MSTALLLLTWVAWMIGNPVSWLGFALGAMGAALLAFFVIIPIELILSLRGVQKSYRAQTLLRAVPMVITLNAPLVLAWVGTYLFWAEAVSAV